MQRQMLKSKIHRATITDCNLHYAGSITIDSELMQEADLLPGELVHVLDIDNGARFETYTIEGRPGSREVCVNGAAARLVEAGDKVIVVSYGIYDEQELSEHRPVVVHVDELNSIVRIDSDPSRVPLEA
jgi:aspartate 1-decarboxylase